MADCLYFSFKQKVAQKVWNFLFISISLETFFRGEIFLSKNEPWNQRFRNKKIIAEK